MGLSGYFLVNTAAGKYRMAAEHYTAKTQKGLDFGRTCSVRRSVPTTPVQVVGYDRTLLQHSCPYPYGVSKLLVLLPVRRTYLPW